MAIARWLAIRIGLALGLLFLLECAARVWSTVGVVDATSPNAGFTYAPDIGWKLLPNYSGVTGFGGRETSAGGVIKVDAVQLGAAQKVLVVSDSTGFGYQVKTEETYAEMLERSLKSAPVINLSVPGYSSEQGRRVIAEYVPRLRPKVVIISFNIDDRSAVIDWPDGDERFQAIYRSHGPRLIRWRFLDLMRGQPEPRTPRVDALRPRVDPGSYRRNLTEMARQVRQSGGRVIFLLLSDDPDSWAWLRRAHDHVLAGRYEAAIPDLLRSVANENPFVVLAKKHLWDAYRRLGQHDKADRYSSVGVSGSVLGGRVTRFDWEYANIMRAVAAAEGADLVDGAAVLNQDTSVYVDANHFNAVGHVRIAAALREAVAKALLAP